MNHVISKWVQPNRLKPLMIACLGLFFWMFAIQVTGADIDAGEDQIGCPGEEVQLGGSPTAGPDELGPFKFEWIDGSGAVISTDPNPTVTVQNEEVIYTVIVEDKDGFRCDDNVKVTPVIVGPITFMPDFLPNDGSSTVTASVEVTPAGRSVDWSIEGDPLGSAIHTGTGVITAGTTSGLITVRATDSESDSDAEGCYSEAPLCVGEDCCREVVESVFGPVLMSVSTPAIAKSKDNDGFCFYSVKDASIQIGMTGVFDKTYSLPGVEISWKERATESTYEFKEVTIKWTGNAPTDKFGAIQAALTELSLTVSSSGQLSGTTKFKVNQVEDVQLINSIAVMKKGTNGTFTYEYTSGSSFQGNWDFSGINGIKIALKKGSKSIGEVTGRLTSAGNLIGRFKTTSENTYTTNGFKVELTSLDLGMTYNIADTEITFTGGTATGKAKISHGVEGDFGLNISFTSSSASATVSLNDVKAFGCEISGTMQTDFDFNFEMTTLIGSGISAQHPEFNQSFSNVGFEITNGDLQRFEIGSVVLKYKSIEFTVQNASYNKSDKEIQFNASVLVPTLSMKVQRFAITEGGSISVGRIDVEFDRSPVLIKGYAEFEENQFKGKYSGKFKGGIDIEGTMVVGSTGSYNYCYFALKAKAGRLGLPLGPSGLKLRELGGEFGYNWNPGDNFATITGSPLENNHVIGFLLGIGDIANLAAIKSTLRVEIGQATTIQLTGDVKVTASSPHYLRGNLSVTYVLGAYELEGSLSSTVKIPPRSGSAVSLNSGPINFGIQNRVWYINAVEMQGTVFNAINIGAKIDLTSPLNNLNAITGFIEGQASFDRTFTYRFPSDFDPSTCKNADDTDFLGFGIDGELQLHLSGLVRADLEADGIDGRVRLEAGGSSDMDVKWPCIVCGDDCVRNYTVTASGLLDVENEGDLTRIHGEIIFTSGGETDDGDFDVTF